MSALPITIIITTYNRRHLIGRAIRSAFDQKWPGLEVLIVDDASTDDTADYVQHAFPCARYVRQAVNRGLCAARNRGITEAHQPWVMFLDDDDTLEPGAIARIAARIEEFPAAKRYPLLQFARSNAKMPGDFIIVTLQHYVERSVSGDFAAVIRREFLLAEGLSLVERLRNGDGLLLWRIAQSYGIPTWSDQVQILHTDAPGRATSAEYQIHHACDYAELQEYTLREFGNLLQTRYPSYCDRKRLGAAAYRLLANQRRAARAQLRNALAHRVSVSGIVVWILSYLPLAFAVAGFRLYRWWTAAELP